MHCRLNKPILFVNVIGFALETEVIIMISAESRPYIDTSLPQSSLQQPALCCFYPMVNINKNEM